MFQNGTRCQHRCTFHIWRLISVTLLIVSLIWISVFNHWIPNNSPIFKKKSQECVLDWWKIHFIGKTQWKIFIFIHSYAKIYNKWTNVLFQNQRKSKKRKKIEKSKNVKKTGKKWLIRAKKSIKLFEWLIESSCTLRCISGMFTPGHRLFHAHILTDTHTRALNWLKLIKIECKPSPKKTQFGLCKWWESQFFYLHNSWNVFIMG